MDIWRRLTIRASVQRRINIEKRERQRTIETKLNETFTPIEELEAIIDAGEAETSKTVVEYGDKPVVIYNTVNLPFRYLEHDIQYSGGGGGQPLMKDPMLWYASKEAAPTVPEQTKTTKRVKMKSGGPYWAAAFLAKSLASLRCLGNKNASIFASLGSLLARTSDSRPVKPKQVNKKYPKGIFHWLGGAQLTRL